MCGCALASCTPSTTQTLKMRTFRVVVELEWRSIVRDVHAEFEV